jgi:hypothetical protein
MILELRSRKLLRSPTDMKNKKIKKILTSLISISKLVRIKETPNRSPKQGFTIEASLILVSKKYRAKMRKVKKIWNQS